MSIVTFLNSAKSKESIDVEFRSILKAIKEGNYKKYVETLATITDKDERRKYKADKVPAIMVSCTSDKGNDADANLKHTGLIAMDFDDVDDLDEMRSQLYADPFTYAGFISVGGSGLCIVVKIDKNKHIDSYYGLEKYYFTKYGYQVDQSCKNQNRLRFVSYDPNAILIDSAQQYTPPPKPKGRKPKPTKYITTDDDIGYIIDQINDKRIDITREYDDWVKIAFDLHDRYGDQGADMFHQISQYHPDYNERLTDRKYRSCSRRSERKKDPWIPTIAAKYGIDIQTPQTKTVATVAEFSKKNGKTAEQVMVELEKKESITPEKSKEIVERVYSDDNETPTSGDLVFQIEQFIRSETDIVYNEVTNKYHIGAKPMTDRDVNSIYLNCRRIIPKTTKDLIISCIDSDRTPIVNPIKDFFKEHGDRIVTGAIRKLADTITTPTGSGTDYTYYFLRKWMIGAVAMWYKHHSPLMLVLAGETQNTGKTHWFRYILPQQLQSYYAEAELNGDKDENLMMCSKALIMNDEMSNKSRRDITMVKKLCSAQWFNLRKPYGKLNEDFRRIAALAGTSNSLELLSDPTGNRRIIPVEVVAIDHAAYNAIDKVDIWVEAYQAFMAGEEFHLTSTDIEMLRTNTFMFEETSLEAEMAMHFVAGPDVEIGRSYHTTSEIKNHIETRTQQRLNLKKLGMELKKLGHDRKSVRFGSTIKQVYYIRLYEIGEMNNLYSDNPNLNKAFNNNEVSPF